MNDKAREVLVAAAMRGHRQVKQWLHDPTTDEGECALGVLHLACHATRAEALRCGTAPRTRYQEVSDRYAMPLNEIREVIRCNDDDGWDFLTIARKVGREDEA